MNEKKQKPRYWYEIESDEDADIRRRQEERERTMQSIARRHALERAWDNSGHFHDSNECVSAQLAAEAAHPDIVADPYLNDLRKSVDHVLANSGDKRPLPERFGAVFETISDIAAHRDALAELKALPRDE